jgi:hypothetical protein
MQFVGFEVVAAVVRKNTIFWDITPCNYFYEAEHYWRGHQFCSHSIVPQHFMEPVSSLPHSQELFTCPSPEPDQPSPHHPILSFQDPSYYYPSTYVLVSLAFSFFATGFPTNSLYALLFSPFVLHAPPVSSSLTSSF